MSEHKTFPDAIRPLADFARGIAGVVRWARAPEQAASPPSTCALVGTRAFAKLYTEAGGTLDQRIVYALMTHLEMVHQDAHSSPPTELA